MGTLYGVQFKANLTSPDWITLPGVIAGTGGLASNTDTNAALQPAGFYRLFERAP
ncbi:MAG TPA: hypothetical protein VNU68_23345 [Verrucomicrobiae bacterium]|nr:hypothetical protein [Verrucomicrobiae bacterium]